MDILVVCTGNICRSPMAEAFLRRRLEHAGVEANVSSAGLLSSGIPASADGVNVLADMGYDTSGHRSRRLSEAMETPADLVLGMARMHVREAVLADPDSWPRSFTLKELVRRAEEAGGRARHQPFDEWLAKVHAGRSRSDLLGDGSLDDIADPYGLGPDRYRATATEIGDLVHRLVQLAWEGP